MVFRTVLIQGAEGLVLAGLSSLQSELLEEAGIAFFVPSFDRQYSYGSAYVLCAAVIARVALRYLAVAKVLHIPHDLAHYKAPYVAVATMPCALGI